MTVGLEHWGRLGSGDGSQCHRFWDSRFPRKCNSVRRRALGTQHVDVMGVPRDRAVTAWAPAAAVAPSDRGPCCASECALSSSLWGDRDGKEKGTFIRHLLCDQPPRGRLCSRISSGSGGTIASVSIDEPSETPEKLNELPQLGEVEPESEFPLGPLQSRGWRASGGVNRAELREIGGFVPPPFSKWS